MGSTLNLHHLGELCGLAGVNSPSSTAAANLCCSEWLLQSRLTAWHPALAGPHSRSQYSTAIWDALVWHCACFPCSEGMTERQQQGGCSADWKALPVLVHA